MTVLYLLPHLGLGDAIICNGLIRVLASHHDRLVLPCKWHNRPSVAWMLSDLENVRLLGVKDDAEAILWSDRFERGGSKVLRLGLHSGRPLRSDWDRQLYEQASVDFEERWRGFKTPVFTAALEPEDSKISFVHDDPKRGFKAELTKLPGTWSYVEHNGKTIWDRLHWLQTAPEIHVIDSCFLCLADSVPTKGRLVFHRYARSGGLPPTLRKNWEVLD